MNSLGFNKLEKDTKVVVAMSGGVDSSVAAVNLKKEGYEVIGVTLRLYSNSNVSKSKSCCAGVDIEDAKVVAKQYNIAHHVLDYQDKFFDGVINNFVESYSNAETPVPCIKCNQTVKFTDLLNEAKKMRADALVTGHYARRKGKLNDAKLYKAIDLKKDQTYFLFATLKEQLNFIRFPIGNYLKSEIRQMALSFNLSVRDKPDSQDICFVSSSSYREFIEKYQPEYNKEGNIYNSKMELIGKHKGITNYTIGQRKGIGIGGFEKPMYVLNVDKKNNSIIFGFENELKKSEVNLKNINWLGGNDLPKEMKCLAKIRSTQKELPGILRTYDNKNAVFSFDNPINSTSPGQACVFYKGEQVLGGGWIT